MMNVKEAIETLQRNPKRMDEMSHFSNQPGIYAFYYVGEDLNVNDFQLSKPMLLYIGKTESSQRSRNVNTHFKDGKTGSSTFRRSMGALFRKELSLNPIPRNDSDYRKGRLTFYKFDDPGEARLTSWLTKNIAMTFLEFTGSKQELNNFETAIIQTLTPPLNLAKNTGNPQMETIQKLRKECGQLAVKSAGFSKQYQNKAKETSPVSSYGTRSTYNGSGGKYYGYWKQLVPRIKDHLTKSHQGSTLQLHKSDFKKMGNRKRYAFNLEYENGEVSNNIGGSAVARDLHKALASDPVTRRILTSGSYKINMDNDFVLHMQKL